uniref:Uncharacterized protein n=1 Tax=Kalanchoe fedtschenkoi TaxID=63787 RepID=A0A7N0UKM1_KALFE
MDYWRNRASASLLAYQNRSDLYIEGVDEFDSDDDRTASEYSCPFCGEEFDVLGLCLHIDDEHPADVKAGVCPVGTCLKKVGVDIVGHMTTEHANLYKVQRRRRFYRGGSNSTFSMLRKEFREGHMHSVYGGSSVKAPNAEPDPLLSLFISAVGKVNESQSLQSTDANTDSKIVTDESSERVVKRAPVSEKEQEEAARKSEFVQGLLLSSIFGDE